MSATALVSPSRPMCAGWISRSQTTIPPKCPTAKSWFGPLFSIDASPRLTGAAPCNDATAVRLSPLCQGTSALQGRTRDIVAYARTDRAGFEELLEDHKRGVFLAVRTNNDRLPGVLPCRA